MKKILTTAFFFLPFIFFAPNASAWNDMGHEVVAQIAYDTLANESPSTRQKLDAIIQADPRPLRKNLYVCAIWPDLNKHRMEVPNAPTGLFLGAPIVGQWHFVDIPYEASDPKAISDFINMPGTTPDPHHPLHSGNVVIAIRYYATLLKGSTMPGNHATPRDRADYVSWLIHFTGDVHQPLHCVTVTGKLPNYAPPFGGDKGGNGFAISGVGRIRELHAFWDDQANLADREKGLKEDHLHPDQHRIASIAHQLESAHPKSQFAAESQRTDPADWAMESYSYRTKVYSLPQGGVPSSQYLAFASDISQERITLAGYRLAALFESILQ